jgi:signal transduction histidine kinase
MGHDVSIEQLRAKLLEAEEARQRAEQLQELTAALSIAASPQDVADSVVERVQRSFEAVAGVVVARLSAQGDTLQLMRATDMPDEIFAAWRSIPIAVSGPLTDAVRNTSPIFLESPEDWSAHYPELLPLVMQTGHKAQMVAPLIVAARCIGAIGVAFREPRCFTHAQRDLLMALAGQCGVALERARLYEAEREARAAAESANRAKGEFLAAMSHELRTPLSAIAGHVDLLALDIYGPTNPQQQDALRRVKRAEEHLLGIVDELLSFARLERGRVEFHLSSVKLSDLLDDLAPLVGPQLAAKNLEFSVPPSGDSLEVEVDRGKLIQVLLNLVSNAIKFTTPGGRISIDVAETPDSSAGQQPTAQISVTDTGIGIPADKLQAIFDPFVQLGTDPANRQGTGLGLAISRDLARGMGGELTARSTPGVSTTFVLTLVKAKGS